MIYIIPFIVAILIFWIVSQKLFFGKENKFLESLAREIGCNYESLKLGSGKIKGDYKGENIEMGVYEGLGNFIGWNRKALSLFSTDFQEKMRGERIFGIKVFLKKKIERPQRIELGMVAVDDCIFYILKGKSRFLTFSSKNTREVKESLEKVIREAKRLEAK